MRVRHLTLALVAVLALVGLSGCGGGPKEAVTLYLEAVADDDGEAACELLTPDAQARLVERFAALGATTCPETISEVVQNVFGADADDLRDASVTDERTDGDAARVKATLDDRGIEVPLARVDDDWKLEQARVGAALLGESPPVGG